MLVDLCCAVSKGVGYAAGWLLRAALWPLTHLPLTRASGGEIVDSRDRSVVEVLEILALEHHYAGNLDRAQLYATLADYHRRTV